MVDNSTEWKETRAQGNMSGSDIKQSEESSYFPRRETSTWIFLANLTLFPPPFRPPPFCLFARLSRLLFASLLDTELGSTPGDMAAPQLTYIRSPSCFSLCHIRLFLYFQLHYLALYMWRERNIQDRKFSDFPRAYP